MTHIVKLDDKVLFEITDSDLALLANNHVNPQAEIERRLRWVIEHHCEQCYERLKNEWFPKLLCDPEVASIPKSKEEFVKLVRSCKEYKNRKEREDALKEKLV